MDSGSNLLESVKLSTYNMNRERRKIKNSSEKNKKTSKKKTPSTIDYEENLAALIHRELGLFKNDVGNNKKSCSQGNLRYPWVSPLKKIKTSMFKNFV